MSTIATYQENELDAAVRNNFVNNAILGPEYINGPGFTGRFSLRAIPTQIYQVAQNRDLLAA